MQNFIQQGEHLEITNTSGATIGSGKPAKVGGVVGVALGNIANNATGTIRTQGVFSFPKKASLAVSAGEPVFWDADPGEITKTAGDGFFVGFATEAAGGPATTVKVVIANGPQTAAAVADVSTANGSDAATTQALANALKTKVNDLLAALRAAGIVAGA